MWNSLFFQPLVPCCHSSSSGQRRIMYRKKNEASLLETLSSYREKTSPNEHQEFPQHRRQLQSLTSTILINDYSFQSVFQCLLLNMDNKGPSWFEESHHERETKKNKPKIALEETEIIKGGKKKNNIFLKKIFHPHWRR